MSSIFSFPNKNPWMLKPYSTANSDPGEAKQKVLFSIESLAYFQTHPKAPGSIVKVYIHVKVKFGSNKFLQIFCSNLISAVTDFVAQLQVLELPYKAIFTAGYNSTLHRQKEPMEKKVP
ncbi:eukaryotic peptide chain release factor GTP-binding subunit ERF3A [Trifolium repens]|nr:eukaryotic peptide chain release factor GTP-binding subunit ERF3A [Trifolium repens]